MSEFRRVTRVDRGGPLGMTRANCSVVFNQIVTVADGSAACVYRVGPEIGPNARHATRLVVVKKLSNPDHRKRDAELFTESRPGLRRGRQLGAEHAVDDGRSAHNDAVERRFAALIVETVGDLARTSGVTHAIFAAGPSMLGFLRPQLAHLDSRIDVVEIPKELTQLSPTALRDRLEADGLLEATI